MLVNVIFHGAWLFLICEKDDRILAIAPDESDDHRYGVGSVTAATFFDLPSDDYHLLGVAGDQTWYPDSALIPMISAKAQGLESADPNKKRYCSISLPFPRRDNIIPLEPYDTVRFLTGKAASELSGLKQFPSVYCFIYECASLDSLRLHSHNGTLIPAIAANPAPDDQTANLHVFATYWSSDLTPEDDKEQMERCFSDLTSALLSPPLQLTLTIDTHKIQDLPYSTPRGVTKDEVELKGKSGRIQIMYGDGHNCQNTGLFIYQTDQMQLP